MKNRVASIIDNINFSIYVVASVMVPYVLRPLFSLMVSPTHVVNFIFFAVFISQVLIVPSLVINLKLHDKQRRVFIRWFIISAFYLAIFALYLWAILGSILPISPHGMAEFAFFIFTMPAGVLLLIIVAYRAIRKDNGEISSFIASVLSMYLAGLSLLFIYGGIFAAIDEMVNR